VSALLLGAGLAAFAPGKLIRVETAPAFTTANSTTLIVGQSGRFLVKATGSPTPVLGESGFIGGHLSFIDNNDGTATLSGIPSPGSAGVYHLNLVATNGIPPDANQAFTLTIAKVPTVLAANAVVSVLPPNLFSLTATLAGADGTAVAGQPVTFSAGGTTVCQAVTDSSGTATCGNVSNVLVVLMAGGFQASFAGDGTYAASVVTSPLLG
jgi:large repetitive protein